jgi:hypothetical protein
MGWHPHALGRSLAALLYLGAWLAASGPMVTYSYFGHVTDNRGSAIPVGTSMLLQLTYPVDLRGLPLDREERIFEYAHDRAAGGVGDSFVSHDASNVTWISGTSWIGTRAVR